MRYSTLSLANQAVSYYYSCHCGIFAVAWSEWSNTNNVDALFLLQARLFIMNWVQQYVHEKFSVPAESRSQFT